MSEHTSRTKEFSLLQALAVRVVNQAEESARTHREIHSYLPSLRSGVELLSAMTDDDAQVESEILKKARGHFATLNTVLIRDFRPTAEDVDLVHISSIAKEAKEIRARRRELNRRMQFAEYVLGKTDLKSAPQTINIDPSMTCNFRCRICHHSMDQNNKQQYLPTHVIDALPNVLLLADQVKLFGGGEPTLSPNLHRLCQMLDDVGIKADLLTNGSTIGKKALPLAQLAQIGISFDGANEKTFQAIRVNSNFESTIKRIREFKQHYPSTKVYFNVVVNRLNIDELFSIAEIAVDLGIFSISFNKMISFYEHTKDLELTKEDIPLFVNQLELVRQIAQKHNITIHNAILTEDLPSEVKPRNKNELFQDLQKVPIAENPKLPSLTTALNNVINSCVEISNTLSNVSSKYQAIREPVELTTSLEALSEYVSVLEQELNDTPEEDIKLPLCSSTWLRTFIRADGTVRPCAMLKDHMGCITNDRGFGNVWNSSEYKTLRSAHATEANLNPTCATCNFPERYLHLEEVLNYLESLGKNISKIKTPKNFLPPENLKNRLSKKTSEIWVRPPPPLELQRGSLYLRQIALTFDGGGRHSFAPEISAILQKHNIQSTMFVTGDYIQKFPDHIRIMKDAGHEFGNHMMTHPELCSYDFGSTIEGINKEFIHKELLETTDALRKLVGVGCTPLWRAPFGKRNTEILEWSKELGYHHIHWSIDTTDWRDDPADPHSLSGLKIAQNILQHTHSDSFGLSGAVILCHLGAKNTEDPFFERLDTLITFLKEMRYEFVTCSRMIADTAADDEAYVLRTWGSWEG